MVGTVIFALLVAWMACTVIMSLGAGVAARRAQRREDQLRREVLMARMLQAHPADSLVRSHS